MLLRCIVSKTREEWKAEEKTLLGESLILSWCLARAQIWN